MFGPRYQHNVQNALLDRAVKEVVACLNLNSESFMPEKAQCRDLGRESDELFKCWTRLAIEEIEAHAGQAFCSKDRPGQLSEPQLISRRDLAKRSKVAGKETHIGNLMVLKRQVQNLRSQLWQQQEWRTISKGLNHVERAFRKARGTATSRADKERIDELEGQHGMTDLEAIFKATSDLDKVIRSHNSIIWTSKRQEWEDKISGSILKGSGLIYRAIKEHISADVPVTKKCEFGTKETVAEQAEI